MNKYFTGRECSKGHVSERRVDNGHCVSCIREKDRARSDYFAEWRRSNKDKSCAYSAAYRERNPEVGAEYMRKMRSAFRDKMLADERRRYDEHREKFAEKNRRYRTLRPDVFAHHSAKRRADILTQTPAWANLDAIQALYERAALLTKETGIQYVVDHIIPLRGRVVCGLHVENNLRVITWTENSKKANKLIDIDECLWGAV